MVREVGGERRQVGSHSTTRKGALAPAVGAVAHEREKAAAAPDRRGTPRLERLRCTVKPFDASNPSYTGDPHARGWPKIGPDQEGTVTGSLSGLFSNGGQQLCQDRITILVPDGSIQP
ncbi:hypothetical protein [Streptomyces virginiae]|uniref:Uncharacterized protein n=1 Tax=Streptomyces virginiae TaxID=1961 RepID=A0ABZ1TKR3_STRVG|nr:hypothetical protein [Streptomyces virginiae]